MATASSAVLSTGGVATSAEHDDGIGQGGLKSGAALPWSLQPAPEALAHHPEGKDPEQQGSGDDQPAQTADQTHRQQDQAESQGQ